MRLNKKVLVCGMLVVCLGAVVGVSGMRTLEKPNVAEEGNKVVDTVEEIEVSEKTPVQEGNIVLLELEGGMQQINVVEVGEEGSNVRKFKLEAQVEGEWQTIYTNDLIENYHLCVLEEPITTDAIRLVVEEEASPTNIKRMSARYLDKVERETPFTNTAYVSSTYFEHAWDTISQENFESLTDIIMIGNFSFNNKGELVIIDHGPSGGQDNVHDWQSDYVKETFPIWKERVAKNPDANLWISITCFKGSPDGAEGGKTDVFNDPKLREKFLKDLVKFAKTYDIAGYDIDWEYPGTASQWEDYNNLILEASKLFEENDLMLSSAQSRGSGLKLESLKALDRINIMAYDNYGTTKNHSTFYNSAVDTIKQFKDKGIDADKLILGMPYYGVKVDDYFAQWDYKHIYNEMIEAQAFDPGLNLYNGWGFNGPNLIRDKVVYAIEQELGGVFCWQMKNDIEAFDSEQSLAGTTSRTIDQFIIEE